MITKPVAILRNTLAAVSLVAIGACTTPIPGAKSIGYENVASTGGAQVYLCTTGSCGDLTIAVHKSEGISATDAADFDKIGDSPLGRKLVAGALEDGARSEKGDIRVGRVRQTSIGGRKALTASLSARVSSADRAPGFMIFILNGQKVEIFVAINDSASRAREQATRLAQIWSKSA